MLWHSFNSYCAYTISSYLRTVSVNQIPVTRNKKVNQNIQTISLISILPFTNIKLCSTVDPWTIWIWTAWIHSHTDFFQYIYSWPSLSTVEGQLWDLHLWSLVPAAGRWTNYLPSPDTEWWLYIICLLHSYPDSAYMLCDWDIFLTLLRLNFLLWK